MSKAKRPFVLAVVLVLLMLGSFLPSGNRVTASAEMPPYELIYTYYSDPEMTNFVGLAKQPCGSWGIYMMYGTASIYYTEEIGNYCCWDVPC
jgi:hypothetical protein